MHLVVGQDHISIAIAGDQGNGFIRDLNSHIFCLLYESSIQIFSAGHRHTRVVGNLF